MIRQLIVTTILLAAVIASSVAVIYQRHVGRQLFVELQQTQQVRDRANVEWSRLQLEQAWLADASRIERIARERLDMQSPQQHKVLVLEQ